MNPTRTCTQIVRWSTNTHFYVFCLSYAPAHLQREEWKKIAYTFAQMVQKSINT